MHKFDIHHKTVLIFFLVTFLEIALTFGDVPDTNIHVPVTGPKRPGIELLDQVMLKYREKIGCTAATLAVSQNRKLLYQRGYGWRDYNKTIPTDPGTMIGIASCEKPMIAAAIKRLVKQKNIPLDTKLLDVLPIQPHGAIVDARVKDITINHILEHKAGWGEDPVRPAVIEIRKAEIKEPITTELLLSFIITFPLEDEPGTVKKYCNFGYDTLRCIVEKWSNKKFIDYVSDTLFGISKSMGIYAAGQPLQSNSPPLIWNSRTGGHVSASARILCNFMERYWPNGDPRVEGNLNWMMYGSLNGSTALMIWRSDGINIVALFNGRDKDIEHKEIKAELEKALTQMPK